MICSPFGPTACNPFPLNQTICFYRNDSLLSSISHPVKQLLLKTQSGAKVEVLDNQIVSADVIHGSKHILLVTSGIGGCNGYSEFYGYYTFDGESLGIFYGMKADIYANTVNEKEISRHCGISQEELDKVTGEG